MKMIFPALAVFTLAACGGDGGGGGYYIPKDEQVNVSCVSCNISLDYSKVYDLNISATGSTITIEASNRIDEMLLTGDNNLIRINGCDISIDFASVTGNDNTVEYPAACSAVFTYDENTGTGNTVATF